MNRLFGGAQKFEFLIRISAMSLNMKYFWDILILSTINAPFIVDQSNNIYTFSQTTFVLAFGWFGGHK